MRRHPQRRRRCSTPGKLWAKYKHTAVTRLGMPLQPAQLIGADLGKSGQVSDARTGLGKLLSCPQPFAGGVGRKPDQDFFRQTQLDESGQMRSFGRAHHQDMSPFADQPFEAGSQQAPFAQGRLQQLCQTPVWLATARQLCVKCRKPYWNDSVPCTDPVRAAPDRCCQVT